MRKNKKLRLLHWHWVLIKSKNIRNIWNDLKNQIKESK